MPSGNSVRNGESDFERRRFINGYETDTISVQCLEELAVTKDFQEHLLCDQAEQLISSLAESFRDVSLGNGITLHEANAIDLRLSVSEQRAMRRLDKASQWQNVPEEHLIKCSSALSFLDPAGFRFYLPAFLTFGLRSEHPEAYELLSSSYHSLLHEPGKSLRQSNPGAIIQRFGFTLQQSQALLSFLRYFGADATPAYTEALERWETVVTILAKEDNPTT